MPSYALQSKEQAGYTPKASMPNERCGLCQHFSAGTCERVRGKISAGAWCKLFKRAK